MESQMMFYFDSEKKQFRLVGMKRNQLMVLREAVEYYSKVIIDAKKNKLIKDLSKRLYQPVTKKES